jgi:hypothetical protein
MLDSVKDELDKLKEEYPEMTITPQPDGSIHVIIPEIPLPGGWNQQKTKLLIIVPQGYPQTRPTVFMTEPNLRLADGKTPGGSGQNQNPSGTWLSFCWQPKTWDITKDALWKYIKFTIDRFRLLQ